MLDQSQIESYQRDGYLVLRSQFTEIEMQSLDDAFSRNPPVDGNVGHLVYPEPGRYTLAKSGFADPGFAAFVEHPAIVSRARQLLADDIHLTAFVLYDRTPGGGGLPMHHDYKRWRPVGSSMDWLFTIVPMTDFDKTTGPLYVAPGSHRLDRICDRNEGVMHVNEAEFPPDSDFVDPELKRGDLLLMNMHLCHKESPNGSEVHRLGLFNKYARAHCPPATGYYLFNDSAWDALSEEGKSLIAVHSDKPIGTTRLLLERPGAEGDEYFLFADGDAFRLPGGSVFKEDAIPDWDEGNYIAALMEHARREIRVELPWVSYVGDYDEGDALCRVYAYPMNHNGFPVPYREGRWVPAAQVNALPLTFGYEQQAVTDWQDPTLIRGKGLTQGRSRIDQFAY